MADVESLELQITGNAKGAKDSLDALIDTLKLLRQATSGGCGLSAVAKGLQDVNKNGEKASASNTKSAKSFNKLGVKIAAAGLTIKKAGTIVASWIKESNDYVENVNLFTVAMGEYADSAKKYAEEVSELMGIDPSDWMRNQGVFMTLATGFGVAGDRAATMSQQLTQLGYDISSFYNTSVEDAMQRLQSGISGELEPLRRLGYDLSQAKLEATALSLGIDKTVSSMTQAEKAELRYYAIMTQVTTAQGDMARTLDAPANQLRILSAQTEQAARALGNIFIPALNAVLPYAIAFLKVIREAATWLANMFGFTMPEVDYSGVDSLVSGGESASDALGEAAGNAKELKKTLLGIDELNVMTDTSSSGASAGTSVGGSFDFDLPEYDFMGEITEQTDKAYKTIKKLLKPVEKLLKYLIEYKEIVLLGAGLIALGKLWGKLKLLWAWIKGINVVDFFLNGFSLIRVTGGTVLQSIKGGFDSIRMSLTGMQKALIVAVAAFAEFSIVKTNVREIALGCENVGAKIVEMGVVVGVAATAMYAALGPAGLAVAAFVGLAGVIAGVTEAQDQMMTAMNNEVFYSGTGTYIGDLGTAYENLMDDITATYQPIIDNQKKIDELRGSVDLTTSSIDNIARALFIGSTTASEKIDEIKGLFEQLKTDTKTIMDEIYGNIVTAIGGSFGQALLDAGQSIPEVLEILKQIRGEGENTLLTLQQELDNLTTDLETGKITHEEFGTRWLAIEEKMKSLIGTTDEYTGVFDTLKDSIGNINWGDEGAKTDFFSQVTASSSEAKDSINQASDAIIENLETMKNWTTDDNLKAKIDEWITIAESDRQRQLKNVDDQLTSLYDAVQQDIIIKAADSKERAVQEWNDMNWFQKWWNGGSEERYVEKAMKNYQKNIVDPISNTINDSFKTLDVEGSSWASSTMSNIIDALFDLHLVNGDPRSRPVLEYQMQIEEAINSALDAAGKSVEFTAESVGKSLGNTIGSGIAQALKTTKLPKLHASVTANTDGTASVNVKAYASGGFPVDGEMFVAREAGPELVGTIGNRSAVVNNDQIVDSVSKGVYQAVSSAMGQSGGTQVVEAKVNDKVLFEVVVSRARQETVRTGYNPLLGGV